MARKLRERLTLNLTPATEARMDFLEKELRSQAREQVWIRGITIAILIVTFIAFIGILFTVYAIIQQYLGTQTATYQTLVDKVDDIGQKINTQIINTGISNATTTLQK